MPACYARGCEHNALEGQCRFSNFPKDTLLYGQWKSLCPRGEKAPTYEDHLCSCHFRDENFENLPTLYLRSKSGKSLKEKQKKLNRIAKRTSVSPQQLNPEDGDCVRSSSTDTGEYQPLSDGEDSSESGECCCCLLPDSTRSLWLPYDDASMYGQLLVECTGLEFSVQHDLRICDGCVEQLQGAVRFRRQVLRAQAFIKERSSKSNKDETSLKQKEVPIDFVEFKNVSDDMMTIVKDEVSTKDASIQGNNKRSCDSENVDTCNHRSSSENVRRSRDKHKIDSENVAPPRTSNREPGPSIKDAKQSNTKSDLSVNKRILRKRKRRSERREEHQEKEVNTVLNQPDPTETLDIDLEVPRKKREKRNSFDLTEKNLVLDTYKRIKETWPATMYPYKTSMHQKTADTLGIGVASVYRILREYARTGTVKAERKNRKTIKD